MQSAETVIRILRCEAKENRRSLSVSDVASQSTWRLLAVPDCLTGKSAICLSSPLCKNIPVFT
jgi:uncharacterized membrane protein